MPQALPPAVVLVVASPPDRRLWLLVASPRPWRKLWGAMAASCSPTGQVCVPTRLRTVGNASFVVCASVGVMPLPLRLGGLAAIGWLAA